MASLGRCLGTTKLQPPAPLCSSPASPPAGLLTDEDLTPVTFLDFSPLKVSTSSETTREATSRKKKKDLEK